MLKIFDVALVSLRNVITYDYGGKNLPTLNAISPSPVFVSETYTQIDVYTIRVGLAVGFAL
ncbi:hypothetical protein [Coxiella-like endosymbiont]|uniref:hypothetical protein n=1 Tax=Coxiella-like endosymbiont TaxID=1592897 RepID=UPI00272A7FDC|nr:hypothetical protein [Coxiella-like endosymbiont]